MIMPDSKQRHPRAGRRAARLGQELERSLSAYAAAALSAGVSLLAITRSAEAKIVYTPANVKIPVNGGPVPLDLNHDGITDFVLSNVYRFGEGTSEALYATLFVGTGAGNTRNKFRGRGTDTSRGYVFRFASALRPGFSVAANKSYFQKSPKGLMAGLVVQYQNPLRRGLGAGESCVSATAACASGTDGQWMYTKNRYLGLQFIINGQTHYGWARVAVTRATGNDKNSILATLTGYAYETVPNKPIITGKTKGPDVVTLEPATLGRLGQGAAGMSAWRAKK